MNAKVSVFIVTAVLLPLLLTEVGEWCAWTSRQLVRWAARRLGNAAQSSRYEEEWLATITEIPGNLSKLGVALGIVAAVPRMRSVLRSGQHDPAVHPAGPPLRMTRPLPELNGFSEHVKMLGRQPSQRLLKIGRVLAKPNEPLGRYFAADTPLLEVERLRLVDGLPVSLQHVVLPAALAERVGLNETAFADETVSIYAHFTRHGLEPARARDQFTAAAATSEQAAALGVDVGEPLIHIHRCSWDAAGNLLEALDAVAISKHYDYRIDLERRVSRSSPVDGTAA